MFYYQKKCWPSFFIARKSLNYASKFACAPNHHSILQGGENVCHENLYRLKFIIIYDYRISYVRKNNIGPYIINHNPARLIEIKLRHTRMYKYNNYKTLHFIYS